MHVREIMTTALITMKATDTVRHADVDMKLANIRHIPVTDDHDHLIGILSNRDVLRALGVDVELAHTSIRFGVGRFTTEEEVDYVIDLVADRVRKLREMSPLYEMVQEGIDIKSIQWDAH